MNAKLNFALANSLAEQSPEASSTAASCKDEPCPEGVDSKRWLKSRYGRKYVRNIADYRAAVAEHGGIFFDLLKKTISIFDRIGNAEKTYTNFSYIHMGASHADRELALIEERHPELTEGRCCVTPA